MTLEADVREGVVEEGWAGARPMPGGRSLLAREGERWLVAKALPADCLTRGHGGGELHAHVKDRLERVREVADVGVASLRGVETGAEGRAYLIWGYVEGSDLSSAFASGGMELLGVARELVSAVERLHLLGIVHGALHLRNVIVRGSEGGDGGGEAGVGRMVLTHVSPLVIDDVGRDAADVVKILRELNARAMKSGGANQAESATLARILAESGSKPALSDLRERLLLAEGARFVVGAEAGGGHVSRPRSFWAGLALLFAGLGVSALVAWWAMGGLVWTSGGEWGGGR